MPVWNQTNAQHLLARTLFGCTRQDVTAALAKSLDDFVENNLLASLASPPAPDVWINEKPVGNNNTIDRERERQMLYWWLNLMLNQGTNFREKMVLFWHNHFVSEISKVNYPQRMYWQQKLFRDFAFGNFKELTRKITTDPAMLVYLDGVQNQKNAPNENYGRELLELFTLGIGNYTEDDIKAASRALTGWQIAPDGITSVFNRTRFDEGDKTFLGKTGKFTHEDIINIIFEKEQTAIFICEKLYREFVFYKPDADFVNQMANVFRSNNYEIRPVLAFLFKSEHFYKAEFLGAKIKSPTESVIGALKNLEMSNFTNPYLQYLNDTHRQLQQQLLEPPDVRGWEGQRRWISSTTFPQRNSFTDSLISGKNLAGQTLATKLNPINFARTFASAEDASQFVKDVTRQMLLFPLSETREKFLLDTLLDGTIAANYSTYTPMAEARIQKFFRALMRLPEYQLC
ncbi:MAG: DUF1800 domain-containing protein [Verrucomicrobia bacterium]|nr:DUF1800 domain-containing protein [Cytophagales bacterium]